MLNTYITECVMKAIKVSDITHTLFRKLGIVKIYYWFNK